MSGVDVPNIITRFCDEVFYKEDYQSVTSYFAADFIPYEDTIEKMREIAVSTVFTEKKQNGTIALQWGNRAVFLLQKNLDSGKFRLWAVWLRYANREKT